MECPYCFEKVDEISELNFTLFRHFGFMDIKDGGHIGRCSKCQLLFNLLDAGEIEALDQLYRTSAYARSGVTNQTFLIKTYGKRATRSFLQTELLSQSMKTDAPAILDIGCFDGTLLQEFAMRYPAAQLHGYDVNDHLRSLFPSRENFHFWSSCLEDIQVTFDLICLSHSMMYIRDIHGLLRNLMRLLRPSGTIFIQTPDILQNPYSILLSDQYYYYTPSALKNIFSGIGLEFSRLASDWFPRDIVGVARAEAAAPPFGIDENLSIHDCISQLCEKRLRLMVLDGRPGLVVLGTTIAAAFVDTVLGDRILFFVDENMESVNRPFRGKKVKHPSLMAKSDCLILPYGASNEAIRNRFSKEYGLTLFESL